MQRLWRVCLTAVLFLLLWTRSTALPEQTETAIYAQTSSQAQSWLNQMTPAERVGQLFIVPFTGDTAPRQSDIASLILNYKVGGVILLAENNNISGYGNAEEVPLQVTQLTNSLQELSLGRSLTEIFQDDNIEPETIPPTSTPEAETATLPLLIAINQEGDGSPYDHILTGLTQLPNNMAIGATWNSDQAQTVGEIAGRELSALGINMFFGPSLDVLENPSPFTTSNQGARSFGGDPYWVSLMGQAYTRGLHIGSENRIAVVPKHFPGNGSSDRSVYDEIPTVRKSLEQLKQIELAPFFAVTGQATSALSTADALLTTHIRYQGFQGNIRSTTAPVSFDPQALTTLMALPEFEQWRQNGGLIVSDALGVRSIEQYFDVTEQEFPHRRIARDAFLAGNDLLYLGDFALGAAPYFEQLANIEDTIVWFQELYATDSSFQVRVDEAVLRILQLKLKLYDNDFTPENILTNEEALTEQLLQAEAAMLELARSAITLIAPSQEELAERLPAPPGPDDNIVIFTDVRQVRQCTRCLLQPYIGQQALEEQILDLYGPEASGQVSPTQIESYTFTDLAQFLNQPAGSIIWPEVVTDTAVIEDPLNPTPTLENEPTPVPTPTLPPPPEFLIQESLRDADWIIFTLLDVRDSSQILSDFLEQRPDIASNIPTIVFAYNAPYFLDTTEISKLTAYYGLYSKSEAFLDTSVRALFQEIALSGRPPVSIEGISYDLFSQTQPDPNQTIELYAVAPSSNDDSEDAEPANFVVGDTLHLQTGPILDHNGNPVPDGTVVQFNQFDRIQGTQTIIANASTINGIARLDYILEASTGPGQFRITAVSGTATSSQEVDIIITGDEVEGTPAVTVIIATLPPTATSTPTPPPTSTPTSTPLPTLTPTLTPTPIPPPQEPSIRIDLSELVMLGGLFMGLFTVSIATLMMSVYLQYGRSHNIGLPTWSIIGGLLLYNYYALNLPGSQTFAPLAGWVGLVTTVTGGILGNVLYWILRRPSQTA